MISSRGAMSEVLTTVIITLVVVLTIGVLFMRAVGDNYTQTSRSWVVSVLHFWDKNVIQAVENAPTEEETAALQARDSFAHTFTTCLTIEASSCQCSLNLTALPEDYLLELRGLTPQRSAVLAVEEGDDLNSLIDDPVIIESPLCLATFEKDKPSLIIFSSAELRRADDGDLALHYDADRTVTIKPFFYSLSPSDGISTSDRMICFVEETSPFNPPSCTKLASEVCQVRRTFFARSRGPNEIDPSSLPRVPVSDTLSYFQAEPGAAYFFVVDVQGHDCDASTVRISHTIPRPSESWVEHQYRQEDTIQISSSRALFGPFFPSQLQEHLVGKDDDSDPDTTLFAATVLEITHPNQTQQYPFGVFSSILLLGSLPSPPPTLPPSIITSGA